MNTREMRKTMRKTVQDKYGDGRKILVKGTIDPGHKVP